jgi:Leucine-rich repeat (LRR) protein
VKLHHGRGCSHWMMLLASTRGCFGSLRVLALNFCGLTSFSSLVALESELPLVEELYVAANQFADISPLGNDGSFFVFTKVDCHHSINYLHPSIYMFTFNSAFVFNIAHTSSAPTLFPSLRILDLSSCGLTSWIDICSSLGLLPNLQELLLDSNPIETLAPQVEGQFAQLKRISLSSTK